MSEKRSALPAQTSNEAILESISDGVFSVDDQWRVRSFNRAAEEITGIPRKEALGRLCSEVFRSSMCEAECALRQTIESGKPVIGKSCYIIDAGGRRIPISVSTAVLRDGRGQVVGGAETFRDLSELEALRQELEGRVRIGDLVSRSPLMQRVCEALPAIAASPSTVLITGQTGTGKELMARTIHSLSPRSSGPFVAVSCGALPDTLLESEFFGYRAGAFTGAVKNKPGRFSLAAGGTLFLDEIGEVSPALQVRLLRVLQERVFEPLGATRSEIADVRVIAATNKDLGEEMRAGRFREDLYYRINVVRLELPPLEKRREDIPILARHFVSRFNLLQKKNVKGLSTEALSLMMAYAWPGNIRELENVIERSFILCEDELIELRHLPKELVGSRERLPDVSMRAVRGAGEEQAITQALERNGFDRMAAAKDLGIHKSTLFRKMRRLGIKPSGKSKRTDTRK